MIAVDRAERFALWCDFPCMTFIMEKANSPVLSLSSICLATLKDLPFIT